jgi:hypothetical protein
MSGLASLGDVRKLDRDTNALVGPALTGETEAQRHQAEMIAACVKRGGKQSECAKSNPIKPGGKRRTRGGACGASDATLSGLGLIYMGNCLWQHRDRKPISHIPKGLTATKLDGKPAYRKSSGGRRTRRRGARASRKRPTR